MKVPVQVTSPLEPFHVQGLGGRLIHANSSFGKCGDQIVRFNMDVEFHKGDYCPSYDVHVSNDGVDWFFVSIYDLLPRKRLDDWEDELQAVFHTDEQPQPEFFKILEEAVAAFNLKGSERPASARALQLAVEDAVEDAEEELLNGPAQSILVFDDAGLPIQLQSLEQVQMGYRNMVVYLSHLLLAHGWREPSGDEVQDAVYYQDRPLRIKLAMANCYRDPDTNSLWSQIAAVMRA